MFLHMIVHYVCECVRACVSVCVFAKGGGLRVLLRQVVNILFLFYPERNLYGGLLSCLSSVALYFECLC